ncbi:MAG: cell surface protein SprA [Saprospiraceae bacterium]|nr:cell surface protein SprA [Saprospiraceae bacterium]
MASSKTIFLVLFGAFSLIAAKADIGSHSSLPDPFASVTMTPVDTVPPLKDREGTYLENDNRNPFDLRDPDIIDQSIDYDPESNTYEITEKIGDDYFRMPTYMTIDEYLQYKARKQEKEYFQRLAGISSAGGEIGPDVDPIKKFDLSQSLIDRLFGGTTVDLNPKGNIGITLGYDYQNVQNPVLLERQQKNGNFDFDMDIQMNMDGSIGDKMKINANYNTKSTFDFDRQLKLQYDSEQFSEDEILKKIEAGNVSLPLKSTLIQGNQSLFGLKTDLQFGRLRLTTIVSQQNSEKKDLKIEKGAQIQEFEIDIDEYDENRHFFLSQYNRDIFEPGLSNLPQISSLFNITKVEVWITNDRRETENTRNIVALADLGENERMTTDNPNLQPGPMEGPKDISGVRVLPDNTSNPIYKMVGGDPMVRDVNTSVSSLRSSPYNLVPSRDFEKVRARKLRESEYTLNSQLGFISINTSLQPDQVLGIAYEYTYNGKKYQVGELSTDFPSETEDETVLFVKLLKGTTQRTDVPAWDLMMKNVYSIGAFNVSREDFYLDVFYEDPGKGEKRFLPSGSLASEPLLRLLNLDNLNPLGDPQPDGAFDFVPGITIFLNTGKIMFPVLEPFGSSLAKKFADPAEADKYVFQQLYDSTIFIAQEFSDLNRFTIRARFKTSATNEYSLGAFNVPQGSVRVTAGGQVLQEGIDYDVDYNLGKVRIINEAYINSSVPINVSFEDNALFSFNKKTMLGLRADYEVSKHLNLGFTYMHLFERPYTQKVNIGEDPINNRILGLDVNYSKEAPWLTRLVDGIPLIDTKAPSNITFAAEGAVLKPGHSRAINQEGSKNGTIYIDDFEGSSIGIDLRTPSNEWVIASIPQNDAENNNPRFRESELNNNLFNGVNRARLNWYRIETNIRNDLDQQNPFTSPVSQQDIFPNRSPVFGFNNNIQVFDVHYDPTQRGPYNFDRPGGTPYSAGLEADGTLADPESRWGGIMRDLRNTDFQAANIEYIEFWVMNPYAETPEGRLGDNGKLFLDLGNISEDILRDSRMSYENGLPTPTSAAPLDTTVWGVVPIVQDLTSSFSIDPAEREDQDLGYDGLNDDQERDFFQDYLQSIDGLINDAKQRIIDDPANDNFQHYRDYDQNVRVFERYSKFNNVQGNSRASDGATLQSSTNYPDKEDLNDDNTLVETEDYYEYEIPIEYDGFGGLAINEFITDTIRAQQTGQIWYRFQIPRERFSKKVGAIQDFRSIRFIRLYMTEFDQPVTLRFAKFDLVRNQWRKYTRSLKSPGPGEPVTRPSSLEFDIASVNIEENSKKFPFNYVLPPGIIRERAVGTYANIQRNEQSLAMNICNLEDADAAAMFKNLNEDFRNYDSLQMFVHAESAADQIIGPGETSLFVRLGSDYTQNYYEYEIPLVMSDPEAARQATFEELPAVVWLPQNELNIPLNLLKEKKIERNNAGVSLTEPYEVVDPANGNKIRIIGNPNLGLVKGIMIGVRNNPDDGLRKCLEVWVNELRLTGLNEAGGTAGLARLDLQLADFGRLSLSGNYSSIGWGALDQKLAERSLDEVVQYDIATNLELGKFFGERSGLRIPFYAQYSETRTNPKFDPYDRDIELKDKLREAPDQTTKDSIREQAIEFTSIKSFNFTNVRKDRTGNKTSKTPKPWDIENFSSTYAQSEIERHDPIIEQDNTEEKRGSLDYNYSTKPLYIQPFKGLAKDSKLIKFITELNFNPIPNSFAVNSALQRQKSTKSYRFSEPAFKTWYTKKFVWQRNYDLNWDFTKSLKFRFNASNNSVIDELNERDPTFTMEANRDTIWAGLRNFGRTKDYTHNINLSYTAPLQYFPLLDFAQIRGQVNAQYSWNAAALNVDSLGNVIQNQQTRQLTADLNFEKLYNNIPYLKKINQGSRPTANRSNNRSTQRPQQDDGQQGKDRKKEARDPGAIERLFIRPLMALRKAKFQYTENLGSVVPGFRPSPEFFGLSQGWTAPGYEYILGIQPDDAWFEEAIKPENQWITDNIFLNQEVLRNKTTKWNAGLSIEPFKDFRVEITWDYSFTENHSEYFKVASPGEGFAHLAPRDVGNFSISYYTLRTLFRNDIEQLFTEFEERRGIFSQRLGDPTRPHINDGAEYAYGYGKYQRDVLVPAFIASYADLPVQDVSLSVFDQKPKPNWQLTYNGLSKVPLFKDIFSSVSLSHGYRSTLSVNSYNTDFDFDPTYTIINEVTGDYYSRFEIPDISITEQLSPLIGLNIKTRNDMSLRLDMNKARNLSLSFTDYQLNETKRTDYTAGFGYRMKNVYIGFLQPKKKTRSRTQRSQEQSEEQDKDGNNPAAGAKKGNDLEIKFDFSYGDNVSLIHKFDTELDPQASRGNKQIRISPSIEYALTETLSLRFFFDYNKTIPYTSRSYPITNINSGVTVQFALQ